MTVTRCYIADIIAYTDVDVAVACAAVTVVGVVSTANRSLMWRLVLLVLLAATLVMVVLVVVVRTRRLMYPDPHFDASGVLIPT